MIKVLIVDDEPFIRQGLQIIINWEQYGFVVTGEASNGKEAVELIEKGNFDLVITDIKMPQMNGLELIEYTWEHISKKIRFILLSGFYEFEYAKKAIKYNVADYILKPVQKEELIHALEEFKDQYFKQIENQKKLEYTEKIVFDRHLSKLISGKYEEEDVKFVEEYLTDTHSVRYIGIEYDPMDDNYTALPPEEKHKVQRLLFDSLKDYLGKHWYHAYTDPINGGRDYNVGLIYSKKLALIQNLNEKEYINNMYEVISSWLPYKIVLYIGNKTEVLQQISESYKTATIAKTFQRFSKEKCISYYDEIDTKISTIKSPIDKNLIDELIRYIEENDLEAIDQCIEKLYQLFKEMVTEPEIIKINLDYLLFNLINLAKELDSDFDQEEVYKMIIYQGGIEQIAIRGSSKHFKNFAIEFSNYLSELRQHALGGVLSEIEKEITEHYMENLSLKSLSEKYFINSAYLGQIFKKQYGIPFKDYLNNYRIDRSAELLIRTDEKVYVIAAAVGFNNTDYFISKFVQIKGITPLQYRKQFLKKV